MAAAFPERKNSGGLKRRGRRIIVVAGTDTGVGKTLLTASLLHHCRRRKIAARALKPFCSGSRDDVTFLQRLQTGELPDDAVNPYYFSAPIAPWLAAREAGQKVGLEDAMEKIKTARKGCDLVILEGAGGVMSPLGEGFNLIDLAAALDAEMILVGANRLGVINHCLLSLAALQHAGIQRVKVVLMAQAAVDWSAPMNPWAIGRLGSASMVLELPFLGESASTAPSVKRNYNKLQKVLARLL